MTEADGTYLELELTFPPEALEAASYVLAEAGTGGLVVDDDARARVRTYLPQGPGQGERLADLLRRLRALEPYFPGMATLQHRCRTVRTEDWSQAWRAYFHPVRVGHRLLIAPTWESVRPFPGEVVVPIDPGMAFGTGTHPSTVLCLQALELLAPTGGAGLDIGTGSGILSLAAVHLGAGRVTACDIDPVAVAVAKANVQRAGVADRVEVRYGSLTDLLVGPSPLPVEWAVANLTAEVLVDLAPALGRALPAGASLVVSGILPSGVAGVQQALEASGVRPLWTAGREGWVALVGRRC